MQRQIQSDGEILNNHEEVQDSIFGDTVELGSLTTASYTRTQTRDKKGKSRKSVNNAHLAETDTDAEEDDLLLSPGKRQQR
jgi:hypothetical protein